MEDNKQGQDDQKPTVTNNEDNKPEGKDGGSSEEKDKQLDFINPFLDDPEEEKEDKSKKEDDDSDEEDEKPKSDDRVMNKIYAMERKAELDNFFSTEEGKLLKQFEGKIREYALDKRAKNLTIPAVAYGIAGKSLLKVGANLKKDADNERERSNVSGSRSTENRKDAESKLPDITKMGKAEFNDLVEKAKRGEIKM